MIHQLTLMQIGVIRDKLEQRRATLRHELEKEKKPPQARDSESQDVESWYLEDLEKGIESRVEERHAAELSEIENTLRCIGDNQFGICIDCGGNIGFDRLLAYPVAKRCFECSQVVECGPGINHLK